MDIPLMQATVGFTDAFTPKDGALPWIVLVLLVVGGLIAWIKRSERRANRLRAEEVSRLAVSLGYAFEAEKPRDFPDLQRLGASNRRLSAIRNMLRGRRGNVEVMIFDCIESYKVGRRSDPTTIACFRLRGKNLPWFSLETSTAQNRLPMSAFLFGTGVVKLDSVPEFARNFLVHTHDHNPEAVRQLFTPEVQSLLLNFDVQRKWFVWGDGEWVCPDMRGSYGWLRIEEYAAFIQRTATLADVFFHNQYIP
jgi:hypothetical protein